MEKILGIIQARMSSTRLPNKVMLPIVGKPILWHIYNRLGKCNVDQICIATSTNTSDDEIEKFALKENIEIFRGSEELVLIRLLGAAKRFKADAIVRITADCPFVDPKIVNQLLYIYRHNSNLDFVSNTIERTFPDGLDAEVISTKFLEKLSNNLQDDFFQQWFATYMIENYKQFNCMNYVHITNLSHLRWTVDYEEDYEFIKSIYNELYPKMNIFYLDDILELLTKKPHLSKINQKYPANTSTAIYLNKKPK